MRASPHAHACLFIYPGLLRVLAAVMQTDCIPEIGEAQVPRRGRRPLLPLPFCPMSTSIASRLALLRWHTLVAGRHAIAEAVIHAQFASVGLFLRQQLQGLHGTLDVDEIGMRETSGLAGSAVDGNAHVDHVPDSTEEVVQIAIRHLERHVANEQSLGGRVLRLLLKHSASASSCELSALVHLFACEGRILHNEATPFEELLVQSLNGFGGGLGVLEVDIAKAKAHS